MRLSLPIVAQHQCEDALDEAAQQHYTFAPIAFRRAPDDHLVLFGEIDDRMCPEPGLTAAKYLTT